MRDDYLSSVWAAHHVSLSTAVHKAVQRSLRGFERLAARQFDAPWRRPTLCRRAEAR